MKWITAAVMLAATGALAACQGGGTTTPDTAAGTSPATAAATPPATSTGVPPTPAGDTALALSGKREVAMVRVQASGAVVTLDGELVETSGRNGRQLFVPTPIGGDQYVIKAYGAAGTDHPANDEPSCWQMNGIDVEDALTVHAAVCDEDNPIQRFTITAKGEGAYVIGSESRVLKHSKADGLTFRDPGGAPAASTFRFVDRGPARVPAGG